MILVSSENYLFFTTSESINISPQGVLELKCCKMKIGDGNISRELTNTKLSHFVMTEIDSVPSWAMLHTHIPERKHDLGDDQILKKCMWPEFQNTESMHAVREQFITKGGNDDPSRGF